MLRNTHINGGLNGADMHHPYLEAKKNGARARSKAAQVASFTSYLQQKDGGSMATALCLVAKQVLHKKKKKSSCVTLKLGAKELLGLSGSSVPKEKPRQTDTTDKGRCQKIIVRSAGRVTFSNVEVREYDLVIGDSPSCCDGLPIALGWGYRHGSCLSVDEFEGRKIAVPRISSNEKASLCRAERRRLLRGAGYSDQELFLAERQIKLREREEFFGTACRAMAA